jgi:hypothetical protein
MSTWALISEDQLEENALLTFSSLTLDHATLASKYEGS